MSRVSINIHIDFYVTVSSFLCNKCQGMRLLGCILVTYVDIQSAKLFSQSGYAILYSCQQCVSDLISLHPCQHFGFVTIFCSSHSDNVCGGITLWIDSALPFCLMILKSFHELIFHLSIFFGEMSFRIFCLFSNWAVCCFYYWVSRVLHIS